METNGSSKGSNSKQLPGESQETKVQINIKTLDSHLHPFQVDRNIPITSLKERIANTVGVPAGQQRLIYRGRVLKDDHILSDYHIENGHTLHLVERQPAQSQSQSGDTPDEASRSNTTGNRGNDTADTMPRARIGHSVVLGVNINEEGTAADLSQIIGSVLNSFGIGTVLNPSMTGNQTSNLQSGTTGQLSHGSTGPQNGNSSVDQQARSQPPQQTGNPSLQNINGVLLRQMAIPDSITTLSTFINRIEQGLSLHSGYRVPPSNLQDSVQSTGPNPVSGSSPAALISVMGQAQRLLNGAAVASLSHLSERLERERVSADLSVRSQIQAEAMHVGLMMQHLGSLFLELGRTISTLRMGEAPMEPLVNSGPAVYINSSGPNPLMVQPVPQQPSPIFGIPSISPLVNFGFPDPARVGDVPRNISIHVQSGTASGLVGNVGEASRGQTMNQSSANVAVSGPQDPSSVQRLTSRTIVTAVPAQASGSASLGSNAILPFDVRVESSNSTQSSVASSTTSSMDTGLQATGYNDASRVAPHSETLDTNGYSLNNTVKRSGDGSGTGRASSLVHNSDVSTSSAQSYGVQASDTCFAPQNSDAKQASKASSSNALGNSGRLVNSSSVSGSSGSNDGGLPTPLGLGLGGLKPKKRTKPSLCQEKTNGQSPQLIAQGQQVLKSLVSNNSQEKATPSGYYAAGSSDASSTAHVRQNQNLAGAFSGMFQQMMPMVSQAFGPSLSRLPSAGGNEPVLQDRTREDAISGNSKIDVQQAVQGIEREDRANLVFHDLLDAAARLCGEGSDLADHLGNQEDLADEFVEMMQRDIQRRLDSNSNQH